MATQVTEVRACPPVSGEHCAHCSIWALRRAEIQWELQEWEVFSSLLPIWRKIKIHVSDRLVSTLSGLISAVICYLDACDVLFYNSAQWELSWAGPGSRSWRWWAVCRGSFSSFRQMLTDVSCIALGFGASHKALHFSCGRFWVILCSVLPTIPHCMLLPCERGQHRQHGHCTTGQGT